MARNEEPMARSEDDTIDPFTFKPPFTLCDKILIVFNALWLFPIRLVIIVLTITLGTILTRISNIGENFDPENPTPRATWRRKYLDGILCVFVRIVLFACGFNWIHVKGQIASVEEAPILILTPHSSLLDVVVVSLYGLPTFVARNDLRNMPIYGSLVTQTLRTIYVRRDDPDSRVKASEEIQRRAASGGKWARVLIFPEGTTHNRQVVLQFKKGPFRPKVPIQIMLLKYKHRLGTTTWGRNMKTQFRHLFYALCQFHNSLEIEFLDVYKPSEKEKADISLFTDNVQELVAKRLGIPLGMHSVEDNFLMEHGEKLGLPFSSCMVLYCKVIQDNIGLDYGKIRDFLTRFASIDKDKDGWITPQDMADFLSVPNDTCLQALFKNQDNEFLGQKIKFRQYLYLFVGRANSLLADDIIIKSIFDFFDKNGDGLVSLADFSSTLPVGKLPKVEEPPRKPIDSRRNGESADSSSGESTDEDRLPSDMNLDNFKAMLNCHPEYLVLFHKHQNAGFSCTPPKNEPRQRKGNTVSG